MPGRPYFRTKIEELERLFESSNNDPQVLQALQAELQHRNKPRARALRSRVEQLLRTKKPQAVEASPIVCSGTEARPLGSVTSSVSPISSEVISSSRHVARGDDRSKTIDAADDLQSGMPPMPNSSDKTIPPVSIPLMISPDQSPNQIFGAWLTLEVLTPQAIPNERELEAVGSRLVRLDEFPEPWQEQRFAKHGKERAVFWMVYLGELDLAKALRSMLEVFPDDTEDERNEVRGTTAMAVVVLDAKGCPLADKTFLSSFAWGYGKVRARQLKGLADFVEVERAIKAELDKRLIRQNDDGKIQPLRASDIDQAITWLAQTLNLPPDQVSRPGVAIRVPQWGWYNEPPEPELLNSFFIEDLVRVRNAFRQGDVGQAISAYMGVASTRERQDVVRSKSLLAETLAPARTPLARWPGPGRYPLVLMQQTAINNAVAELVNGGLVAINGPPGTGKTTLLRDIVAKVVLDRAIAMSEFEKPESAFTRVTTMRTGNAYSTLYQLHESLHGHEIVVASSNNKAVENISREIPSSSAVADNLDSPLRYFHSISDVLAAGKGPLVDGATWGLAAAVLGNAANRSAFVKAFWWHKKRGMARYLKAIIGDLTEEIDGDETDEDEQRLSDVVSIEQPPRSEIEALQRWRIARKDFLDKLKAAQDLRNRVQDAYSAVCRRPEVIKQAEAAAAMVTEVERIFAMALDKEGTARRLYKAALDVERKATDDRTAIDRLRPGFFARLFWTRGYREWRHQMALAIERVSSVQAASQLSVDALRKSEQDLLAAKQGVASAALRKASADRMMSATLADIEAGKTFVGANFADDTFWNHEDASLQTTSPWIFNDLQRVRDELFVAAFALHRAFIDASAKYLRHNIRASLDLMKGRELSDKQEPARRSIWASLFLMVPVISTTFASTARLFGRLEREQLGWLLIDEAGQTVPQAAAGALWRAKRAIVIGDPLQIKPVVTIPPKLIRSIFAEFGVRADEWAGPEMSAQVLADRVSWFGTSIQTSDGDIWIGSPLRVHRRCEDPMFSISNHVAYDGLMVYGTPERASPIGEVLGVSQWINVDGDAVGKWSEREGEVALQLFHRLFEAGIENPDIFFISPFRIVSRNLREMIRKDRVIADRLSPNKWEWTSNRVGTIHTFQGKEADTVVLVLGAPLDASAGARQWAGNPPNLLNVAVTRAKRRLFVIGNRAAWKDAGVFSHLAQMLPVSRQMD